MANAALAGGVAIGATCNVVSAPLAFVIGTLAGALCVLGYAVIQARLQKLCRIVDTCCMHNLHGIPGLLGGLAAIFVVPGIVGTQTVGIAATILLALAGGVLAGFVLRTTGTKRAVYEDNEDFAGIEA